jgi:hypothetical protein
MARTSPIIVAAWIGLIGVIVTSATTLIINSSKPSTKEEIKNITPEVGLKQNDIITDSTEKEGQKMPDKEKPISKSEIKNDGNYSSVKGNQININNANLQGAEIVAGNKNTILKDSVKK